MPQRFRTSLIAAVAIAIGLLVPLVLAELVLQFSPVLSGLYQTAVNADHPVGQFEPNRRFTYSLGPRFEVVVRGRTNNLGWVNDQDYDSTASSPLLAVVGDSYVEALMVPYRETLHGRLASTLGARGRVYSFGASGAPLAHYLVLADYARRTFRPSRAAIVVVGNDFDESLRRYKVAPGLYGFAADSAGRLTLQREDYRPVAWKRLVRKSALVRYLVLNLKVGSMVAGRGRTGRAPPSAGDSAGFAGNVRAHADSTRLADSRRAVDVFLSELPARIGLAPGCVALVVDGVRPQLYDARTIASGDSSYFGRMRSYLSARARGEGYDVVDLQPAFVARYAVTRRPFEHANDGHWDSTGHAVAAATLARSPVFTSLTTSVNRVACVPISASRAE